MILLRLYPRAWRERYEAEMLALIEEHDVALATPGTPTGGLDDGGASPNMSESLILP